MQRCEGGDRDLEEHYHVPGKASGRKHWPAAQGGTWRQPISRAGHAAKPTVGWKKPSLQCDPATQGKQSSGVANMMNLNHSHINPSV